MPERSSTSVTAFARSSDGLIVLPGALTVVHRDLIVTLAAQHRLPAVYPLLYFVTIGGLVCYASDEIDQYGQAAGYIDRILKGEKPANVPVRAPTKYKL
jgi:putative tryptophan/tyrosine transport system substrate-binding protein